MPTETVTILGAGGHASVVVDALLSRGWLAHRITLRDDRAERAGTLMLGCRIESPALASVPAADRFHAAIGDNGARRRLLAESGVASDRWLIVCHPQAVLAPSAKIGAGCFFAAQSVTGPNASIGHAVIINHGAIVDHDCRVGHFSHIAPRASLGGGVSIGDGVLVGAGATVLPGVTIGNGAVIGAGSVVLHDVAPGITVAGVPAHPINKERT